MLVVKEQQQNVTQVLHNHGVKFAIVLSINMAAVSLVRAINHQGAYSITTSTKTRTPEICIFNEQTQKYLHAFHLPF